MNKKAKRNSPPERKTKKETKKALTMRKTNHQGHLLSLLATIMVAPAALTFKIQKTFSMGNIVYAHATLKDYAIGESDGFLYFTNLDATQTGRNLTTKFVDFWKNNNRHDITSLASSQDLQAVMVGSVTNELYLVEFKPGAEGTVLGQWICPSVYDFPFSLVLKKVDNKNYFLTSFDNETMYTIDALSNSSTSKPTHLHKLDLVKELSIAGNFYVASGIENFLVMNDWTNGDHLRLFTTMDLDKEAGQHRINGLEYINLENDYYWFAIGCDNARIYIYDAEKHNSVTQFDEEHFMNDIIHMRGTEFLVINCEDYLMIHNIFTRFSLKIEIDGFLSIGKLSQYEQYVVVGDDYGELFFMDPEDKICSSRCKDGCKQPVLASGCNNCKDGFTLKNGVCEPACPSGKFFVAPGQPCADKCNENQFRKEENVCQGCDGSCKTCSFSTQDSCTSCNTTSKLSPFGQCLEGSSCGDYAYLHQNGTCARCPQNCLNCSATQCFACRNSSYALNKNSSQCVESCRAGQYFNTLTKRCSACAFGCAKCFGAGSDKCLSCVPGGFYYYNSSCYLNCPVGTYHNHEKEICVACPGECAGCTPEGHCYSCKADAYLNIDNGLCQKTCDEEGTIALPDRICATCGEGCRNCTVEGCTECYEGFERSGPLCLSGGSTSSNFLVFVTLILVFLGPYLIYKMDDSEQKEKKGMLKKLYDRINGTPESNLDQDERAQINQRATLMLNDPPEGQQVGGVPGVATNMAYPSELAPGPGKGGADAEEEEKKKEKQSAKLHEDPELDFDAGLDDNEVSYQDEGDDDFGDVFDGNDNPYA